MGEAMINNTTTSEHLPLYCEDRLSPAGKPLLLAELGMDEYGIPGIYLWCKVCRKAHHVSLTQIDRMLRASSLDHIAVSHTPI